jgi:phage/plasmid-associated DNA primase
LLDRDGAVSGRWRVFAFPSTFLLDQNGQIRFSVNTAIEWDTDEAKAVIDGLLKEAKAAK